MNRAEKAVLNNPVRRLLQRTWEAPELERLGGRVEHGRVLEVGCGSGGGTRLLFDRFGAEQVTARALQRWSYQTFFEHPTEDRFDPQELTDELERHGLRLLQQPTVWWFGDFVLGAAVRDG